MAVDFKPKATSTIQFTPKQQPGVMPQPAQEQPGFLKSLAMSTGIPRLAANAVRVGQILTPGGVTAADIRKDPAKPVNMPWLGPVKPVGQEGTLGERAKDTFGEAAKFAATVAPVPKGLTGVAKATLGGRIMSGAKTGVMTGGGAGALYGFGEGIQQEGATVGSVAASTAINGAFGAAGGGLVGGVLPLPVAGVQKAQQRFMPTAQQGLEQLRTGYDELFGLTKAGMKRVEKSSKAGKDPSLFLASKGLVPEVTPDGKLDTTKIRQALTQEADQLDDQLTAALKDTGLTVPIEKVRAAAVAAVDNPQTRADASVFARQQEVNNIFDTYKKIYGEVIPLDVLNEVKRGQYRLTKSFDATKPAFFKDVNYKIASAAKETIEKTAKDLNVEDFNRYYGDVLDASGLLEKVHGNAVKGGRLGKYFAETGGMIAGSIGGGTVGGIPGIVLGGLAGKSVSGAIQKRSLQNAIASKAATKAVQKGGVRTAPALEKTQRPSLRDMSNNIMTPANRSDGIRTLVGTNSNTANTVIPRTATPSNRTPTNPTNLSARSNQSSNTSTTRPNIEKNPATNRSSDMFLAARKQSQNNNVTTPTTAAIPSAPTSKSVMPSVIPQKRPLSSALPTAKNKTAQQGQMFAGGAAGFEKDDQGNITFSPEKALIGMAAMAGASKLPKAELLKRLRTSLPNKTKDELAKFVEVVKGGRVKTGKDGYLQFASKADRDAFNAGLSVVTDKPLLRDRLSQSTPGKIANLFDEVLDYNKNMQPGLSIKKVADTAEDQLMREARKYKSAEDFVKGQEGGIKQAQTGKPVTARMYHGSPDARFAEEFDPTKAGYYKDAPDLLPDMREWESLNGKPSQGFRGESVTGNKGVSFTDSRATAKSYSEKPAFDIQNSVPMVLERYVTLKNPKVYDMGGKKWDLNMEQEMRKALENGHDGLVFKNILDDYHPFNSKTPANNLIVLDTNAIKTRTQLTDIWQKANR